ncbi:FG-GAP repeat domain-containing protein [Loktanella sp. R86503]|uniref:FG-GAP repeat domain-containing protein n=1 Tax=Loktanella sp. R86503 TaxID=3093847 RepID=UPI0036DF839F
MRIAVAAGLLVMHADLAAACDSQPSPPAALAGSLVVASGGVISHAWYDDPTTIYDHGILGDAIEAATLRIATAADCNIRVSAGAGHVFEDTAPRLADLDGDGSSEVIAVRSSLTQGAQLVVYGLRDGALVLLDQTPYIGQTHRWLSPIGAGDIDGDGRMEVAYIDRPHLARILRIWRFDGAALTEAYRVPDLTNHRIGEQEISGGFRTCDSVTEAIVAAPDWSRVLAVRIEAGKALMRDLGPVGPGAFQQALACKR